jgi:hypothetical protein
MGRPGTRTPAARSSAMPILILILLVILIAQFGFWDTLQAILGAVAMMVILWAIAIALGLAVVRYLYRKLI